MGEHIMQNAIPLGFAFAVLFGALNVVVSVRESLRQQRMERTYWDARLRKCQEEAEQRGNLPVIAKHGKY